MVFNNVPGRNNENAPDFYINDRKIEYTDSYCYLGIIIDISGRFKLARDNLKHKAMRALFSFKRSVNKNKLSFRALIKLFDSLIKPIVLYGAPVWTPTLPIINSISKDIHSKPTSNLLKKISASPSERIHLHFLKWALGLHKKATNVAVWGDTGRYPLIYECIKLTLNYYKRVDELKDDSLVYAALLEQKSLNLNWYKNIENLLKIDKKYTLDHVTASNYHNGNPQCHDNDKNVKPSEFLVHNGFIKVRNIKLEKFLSEMTIAEPIPSKLFDVNSIYNTVRTKFIEHWKYAKSTSPKLMFYNSLKLSFSKEPYIDAVKNAHDRYNMTRLRISAHDLNIERGRYKNIGRSMRFCHWCKSVLGLESIEDEFHLLNTCDLYTKHREKFSAHIKHLTVTLTGTLQDHNVFNLTAAFSTISSPPPIGLAINYLLQPRQEISCFMNLESKNHSATQAHPDLITSFSRDTKSHIYRRIAHFIHNCFETRQNFISLNN